MVKKFMRIVFAFSLLILSFCVSSASPEIKKAKHILLINSYDQGFAWTDSLTRGISNELRKYPNTVLHLEYLNSKQFGQSNFDITKLFFTEKYRQVHLDGVLVTDNDALDFAVKYEKELFPSLPIVFAGISNPEDYLLAGTNFFGFKETSNTDSIISLIRQLLPNSKKLLIITDNTTTGLIYQRDLVEQQKRMKDFAIEFPKEIDIEHLCKTIDSDNDYDAIFYLGINLDKYGNVINNRELLERIGKLAKVPLFSNDILYIGKGVIGGLFQSGVNQGAGAANLLVQLMNSSDYDSFEDVYIQNLESFFDFQLLEKFDILESRIPEGAIILNQKSFVNKQNFTMLLFALILMLVIILFLSIDMQRRKALQLKSDNQLREIEEQKNKLENTSKQLENVISKLEDTNAELYETNINLLEAKEKAEESDNLKSAFLANVSHELRTPLNSIVGFSSLLTEPDLDSETKTFYSGLIESNSESLLVLIDEIIDLSKIEAHQLTINKQEFSVDDLITELFETFKTHHSNSPIELRVRKVSDEKELFVFSDRVRVKQILTNLLTNAYKFTEKEFIEIGYIETKSHQIQLYVKDSGIGIEKKHLNVVFDRFRKLNDDKRKIYGGTGLGLAISKRLVELLGGQIWVTSEIGKGSVFYFTLSDLELRNTD